ncbi:MAG: class I SAM-dependent methyltransferase [Alphaproteobacteria bacterium]|nr:class I SAM-dependent methyltransferase [Alphaproteobacteria bacterium]
MTDARLAAHRAAWPAKPALRAVYQDLYRRIAEALPEGRVLEVGGGSGRLKGWLPTIVATDILPAPWLDVVADAHRLPFRDGCFAAIVMVDVMHHLAAPGAFLAEACRVLIPGGRIIMVEPAITPLSRVAFALAHPEPVDMDEDPFAAAPPPRPRDAFAANQALPSLIVGRHRARLAERVPGLAVATVRYFSLFAYPLSGGYRRWSLIPGAWAPALLRLEARLEPWLGPLLGFRLFAVIERR